MASAGTVSVLPPPPMPVPGGATDADAEWCPSCRKHAHKAFLFDCGSSSYADGTGGPPMQPWFVDLLRQRRIELDGMFMWEVTHHDPATVWSVVPDPLRPRYHWINTVTFASSDTASNGNHPLLHQNVRQAGGLRAVQA